MRILSRHFLASYLTLFASILLSSLILIAVIELLLNFDDIFEEHEGLRGILTYMFLRLPSYYFADLVPITSFSAAFFCMGLPARLHEVTAVKAGGISPLRLAVPVLIAAASLAALTLLVNETIVLDASRGWQRMDERDDLPEFGRGSFWYHRGDALYNVRAADRETRILSGVSVYETNRHGRLIRKIEAERARIVDGDRWQFLDATIRTFRPDDPTSVPEIRRVAETSLGSGRESDLALLDADPRTLGLLNLRQYIAALTLEGRDAIPYRAMLHSRLAEPVTVLLFALLGIPLGLAVEQTRSVGSAALQGIAVMGVYYTVRSVASAYAGSGLFLATTAPWLLLTAFGGYGAWRCARVPR